MRARLTGARAARGNVLIFLDAHCEVTTDWMRPLLQRIRHKRDAVLTPIIDVIDQSSFELQASDTFQVGGFSFMGHFLWTDVPEREKKRRGSDIGPTWSPTMAGGLFAISRDYFWELGAYDEQMGGWGGENLEMSFRIWQCGGTLETIPCSRVGHVFRSFHPYGMPASSDTHGINTARMAEVWMDEYAELFYLHRPDLRKNPIIGDVTHRKILREKLKCKSFQWYLDNIYQEKFVPVKDVYGYGRFRNEITQMCLDTLQKEGDNVLLGVYPCHADLQASQYFSLSNKGEIRDETNCASVQRSRFRNEITQMCLDTLQKEGDNVLLGVYPCHADLQASQYFSLSNKGEIRDETNCASVQRSRNDIEDPRSEIIRPVVMSACHGKGRDQKWVRLPTGQLQHVVTKLCITAPHAVGDVQATVCKPGVFQQIWVIDYTEDNNFRRESADDVSSDQERRISMLRGQRRISRSLMSYSESNPNQVYDARRDDNSPPETATVRRHTHKNKHHKRHGRKGKHGTKKRTKNKFILKLVRTLMNGTEDHLEVDIHCKHRQLYPNNTFVRDLVTILNDKNVKVINNGRVFERNKVSELDSVRPQSSKVLNKMDIEEPNPQAPSQPVNALARMREGAMKGRKKSKVVDVQTVISREPVGLRPRDIPAIPPAMGSGFSDVMDAGSSTDKKLIIEDFVEVKRIHTTVGAKRHRRKRKRHGAQPAAHAPPRPRPRPAHRPHPHTPPQHTHSVSTPPKPKESGETAKVEASDSGVMDSPLVDDSIERSSAKEDWTPGDSRYRRNKQHPQPPPHRAPHPHEISLLTGNGVHVPRAQESDGEALGPGISAHRSTHQDDGQKSSGERGTNNAMRRTDEAAPAPVKLVMRSNLTFNLGDEFFSWKNKATDDIVNDFLGELTIPSNDTDKPQRGHDERSHQHYQPADTPLRNRGDDNQPRPNDNQGRADDPQREEYRQDHIRLDTEDNHVRSDPGIDAGRESQGNYGQQTSPDVQQENQKDNLVDTRNESAPQSSSSSESSGE
ncbi:unnamed protein product [Arctia plantaginis]|uniref:Ricin B lectin domain-containing protein n=1 Tax=Arctia plantaginis TaxID=874455 RepID=A0A8S0YQ83_ARCPL|nr:unnamed protein product [Arctia plantaginis]